MEHPKVTNEEMMQRVMRFDDLKKQGIPLMFIDSILPRHQRMNYAVIGDTASENPEFAPFISDPHKFQIGMFSCLPNCGPAYHTHDYVELFLNLTGTWRYYWGNDPDGEPDGEVILGQWDLISFPPGLWRGFEVVSDEPAWGFAVLDPHTVFEGKDPYWAPHIKQEAAAHGFHADESGKMIKPDNYEELKQSMKKKLEGAIRELG